MQRLSAPVMLVALVSGCGALGGSPTPEPAGDPQETWELVEGETANGPILLVDDHPITITIAGSTLGGEAPCNHYGADFEQGPDGVRIGQIDQTLRGCADDVMAAEASYTSALAQVTTIRAAGQRLVLSGPGVELQFTRLPEPPTAEILDTRWVLETMFVGDVASAPGGEEAFLELRSDGTFVGSTGCRRFDGTWIENGNQITATAMDMLDMECVAASPEQDGHVVRVIGDGFVPTVEGDLLTLMDPGGIGLVYRASE